MIPSHNPQNLSKTHPFSTQHTKNKLVITDKGNNYLIRDNEGIKNIIFQK